MTVPALFAVVCMTSVRTQATGSNPPDPAAVRQAAFDAGLDSLAHVAPPDVPNLNQFLNPGPAAMQAALVLGKAFFWDMQVGSDGQACGSCHFHAGADSRAKNQLNPGLRGNPPDSTFGLLVGGFSQLGPNYTLTPGDFPFHLLADPDNTNFNGRVVLRDTNDVVSSQGVFKANFVGISGTATDAGTPVADPIFNVMGVNVRRVEPRNTPTMVNAVFNSDNFWDGRARNQFNGMTPLGLLDTNAKILVNDPIIGLKKVNVVIPNSSLASQAVGPPLSPDEMSFVDRTSQDVGHKLFARRRGRRLLPLRPLALQQVHMQDSVLGPFSAGPLGGLTFTSYADLVMTVFQPKYWNSVQLDTFDADGNELIINSPALPGVEAFKQMEANFSLFFGLAVEIYERTLISDQTPFDRFMEGDDTALTADQLTGLLAFINTGEGAQAYNPIFDGVSKANCVACHSGPEFTEESFTGIADQGGLIEIEQVPALVGGELVETDETAFLDTGFANIGVRPTAEDLARGGLELNKPLSHVRERLAGFSFAPPLPPCGAPDPPCPAGFPTNPRVQVDGAFKIPGLRNAELTGPYFHNGGQATLTQVVEFYNRHGDFGDRNIANINSSLANVAIEEDDEPKLVAFLLSLTDDRVRNEKGPFDHPQIFVPNGHPGDQIAIACFTTTNGVNQACDARITIPAIGRNGRAAEGLPPLGTFLDLSPNEP